MLCHFNRDFEEDAIGFHFRHIDKPDWEYVLHDARLKSGISQVKIFDRSLGGMFRCRAVGVPSYGKTSYTFSLLTRHSKGARYLYLISGDLTARWLDTNVVIRA